MLRLHGWGRAHRLVLLRHRPAREPGGGRARGRPAAPVGLAVKPAGERQRDEVVVLVTSLAAAHLTLAQLYRDRADGETEDDEPKNHAGTGGFTTRDLERCRLMAGIVALVDNGWSLVVRPADPDHHREGITSRPCCCTPWPERAVMPGRRRSSSARCLPGYACRLRRRGANPCA